MQTQLRGVPINQPVSPALLDYKRRQSIVLALVQQALIHDTKQLTRNG